MEKNVEKALDAFVDPTEKTEENEKDGKAKKVILNKREGLIERVDRVFVTEDGRQLLREHY